jgi:hypothetical protein
MALCPRGALRQHLQDVAAWTGPKWKVERGPSPQVTRDDPGNLVEMAGGSGKLTVCELENGHRNSGFTHEYGSHLGILVLLNPIVDVC